MSKQEWLMIIGDAVAVAGIFGMAYVALVILPLI